MDCSSCVYGCPKDYSFNCYVSKLAAHAFATVDSYKQFQSLSHSCTHDSSTQICNEKWVDLRFHFANAYQYSHSLSLSKSYFDFVATKASMPTRRLGQDHH